MTPWSQLGRSARLRAIGWAILASGVIGAGVFYWIATRTADAALDDTTALGYTRSLEHGMGVMMGRFGLMLTEWQTALTTPTGEALMIVAGAALFAGYFFRVAWVIDQEAADEQRSTHG